MYRIGILSRPGRNLSVASSELHKNPFFHVKSYTNASRAALALKDREYDALVMICDEFLAPQVEIVNQIKKHFPELPFVILAVETSTELKEQMVKYKKTLVLDAKTEMQDVSGVVLKMLNNQPVFNRSNKRFRTSQSASLHNSETQAIHPSWLFNLAAQGAQLRVFGKTVEKGEKLNLKIFLPQLNKEHQVEGIVVWTKSNKYDKNGKSKDSQMVGVQFLAV